MSVPLLELVTQNKKFLDEFMQEFESFMLKGQYILGDQVTQFEEKIAKHLDVKHAIGVSSGTDALVLALMALDIQPGDEVLCPSFSFFATAGCISRLGAIPIFVDVCADSFNVDLADAERKVTKNTRAIIPVHLFGQSCEMSSILEFAKEKDIAVVEDTAQSLGSQYGGQYAGTMGELGCYSFFPSKNLGSIGDAGLLVTNDDKLAERSRILRLHGSQPKYYHKWVGGNFRMDALHALFLRLKLDYLSEYETARASNANYYHKELISLESVDWNDGQTSFNSKLLLPKDIGLGKHVWNQFTIRVGQNQRDKLWEFLKAEQIGAEVYYPVSLHQQECFEDLNPDPCPVSEMLSNEVLSIPIYPELQENQLSEVVGKIVDFLNTD